MKKKERRAALDAFLRRGELAPDSPGGPPGDTQEHRDLSEGAVQVTQTASVLVQAAFYRVLLRALRKLDALFDPAVTTFVSSQNGSAMLVPTLDDTANAATVVTESTQDTQTEPTLAGLLVPTAANYRTGLVKISRELLEDSAFDPGEFLAESFAIRLARGIGASLVGTLLSGATAGATTIGSASNTGGVETGATSIGSKDLVALLKSVDPAYRETGGAAWVMNANTLASLDALLDKQGRPALPPIYVDGERLLFNYPIALCPSMPDIAANAKPVAFGDLRYLVVCTVQGATTLQRLDERFADYGQVAFRGWLRASSALGVSSAVKYLVNASS